METHFDPMTPTGDLSREKVRDDIRVLLRDAEELLKITAGDMSDRAKEARARLADAIENAKGTCQKLEVRTLEAVKATDKVIRNHPYESIGVAFGFGILLGALVARK